MKSLTYCLRGLLITLMLTLSAGWCANAQPDTAKRIALVIGNDNYLHHPDVPRLNKAGNDATAMAAELRAAGFDQVLLHRDLNYRDMVKAVETFLGAITGGDQAVVFFAGHGVQFNTGNYLLPTDIELSTQATMEKTSYSLNDFDLYD